MSDTPRTDKRVEEIRAAPSDGESRFRWMADFARELERELAQGGFTRFVMKVGGGGEGGKT